MRVTAELFGDLRGYLPRGQERLLVEVPEGATVRELGQRIGFDDGEVWRVGIGERLVEDDELLRDGDLVLFFPPIGGGSDLWSLAE